MRWLVKVTMVARDVASSRALDLVRKELFAKGVDVVAHLGNGSAIASSPETILENVRGSDLVFLGMSSSPELAKEETMAAAETAERGIPYGFYADLPGVANRAWFEPFRKSARFVFVFMEQEIEANRSGFPRAEIVAAGNPMFDNSFFHPNKYEQVRRAQRINVGEYVLYCTAGKDLEANRAHFQGVADAVSRLPDRYLWKIFFMLHPGDENDPGLYADFTWIPNVSARVMCAEELPSLDGIAACDIMVGSVSTSEYEAACMRKPVITVLWPTAMEKLKNQYGSDRWHPCEIGISRAVTRGPEELAEAIRDLMFGGAFREMRARQEACFPVPSVRGAAVKTMTETILKLLG